MWADTLLAAERAHVFRLALWGGGSVLVGTMVLALVARPGRRSPLLQHFAIQTAAWGAIDVAIAAWAWQGLRLRDLASAVSLDRFIWLNVGLDAGYILVGATLAILGWKLGPRLALVGAGIGVIVQGLALLILDLVLTTYIARIT